MERGLRGDLLSQRAETYIYFFQTEMHVGNIYYICSILSKIVIKIMEQEMELTKSTAAPN